MHHVSKLYLGAVNTTVDCKHILKCLIFGLFYYYHTACFGLSGSAVVVLTAPKHTFKPQRCFRHRIWNGVVNIDTIFLVVFVVILIAVTFILVVELVNCRFLYSGTL